MKQQHLLFDLPDARVRFALEKLEMSFTGRVCGPNMHEDLHLREPAAMSVHLNAACQQ